MRARVSSALKSFGLGFGLGLGLWAHPGLTQPDREFVFADSDGHLVLRFVGSGASPLEPHQIDEISNAEFSSMVHDRLRADLLFEAEQRDPARSATIGPRLAEHMELAGQTFTDVRVECRAASCRVIMEQPGHWTASAHRPVLEAVQQTLDEFLASHRQAFEPTFLLTAYYQQAERPHIKAFLRRAERPLPSGKAGHCEDGSELCYGQHAIEPPNR